MVFWHILALYFIVILPCTITDQIRIGRYTRKEYKIHVASLAEEFMNIGLAVGTAWAIWHWLHHFNIA